ncbi:ATP-binding protein [Streptomyces sp. NPDC002701]|uniref:ATP-binding protein n=1 Tax=Streptomyces sp. NPDC002701 TaxID=3364661 RepID=UPI0036929EAE
MSRKPWDLDFTAEPEEVAALRRVMMLHLQAWGLEDVTHEAQLCVSELVSNVITHVGPGTPTTLAVSVRGTRLRIEIHDPDMRALPTLLSAGPDSEGGRGMALVDAVADNWGVLLLADRKVTWCELATGLSSGNGYGGGARAARVETVFRLYDAARNPRAATSSAVCATGVGKVAIDVIIDVLYWLRAHGCDPGEALARAQTCFEAEVLEPSADTSGHRS